MNCLGKFHKVYNFGAVENRDELITQRRSIAKNIGCFQQNLFVCGFVSQHDNFRKSKRRMMKLGGRCIVQKFWPSSNLGVIAPLGVHTPKMSHSATMLGKSAQAV